MDWSGFINYQSSISGGYVGPVIFDFKGSRYVSGPKNNTSIEEVLDRADPHGPRSTLFIWGRSSCRTVTSHHVRSAR